MHPLLELLLNPTAGAAGFNLISFMFYAMVIITAFVFVLSKSIKD